MDRPNLTTAGLRDWLKTQDRSATYNFEDVGDCLNARFLKSQGLDVICGSSTVDIFDSRGGVTTFDLPTALDEIGRGCSKDSGEYDPDSYRALWTYAAALERCEERLR